MELVHAIKSHKDLITNVRFATVIDAIPEDVVAKNMSFSVNEICLGAYFVLLTAP